MRDIPAYNFLQVGNDEKYKILMIKAFGRNIKNLRLSKKLTQEKVGELAGINPKYLGEIERGIKNPTAVVIYKLSQALGVSVAEIMSLDNYPCCSAKVNMLRDLERLFEGKDEKDIQKAIKILEVFFE